MGWGNKAIEIRSTITGEEVGSFKHKRAMRVSNVTCSLPTLHGPFSTLRVLFSSLTSLYSCASSVHETTRCILPLYSQEVQPRSVSLRQLMSCTQITFCLDLLHELLSVYVLC
jgi:hypothetical protein